MLNYIVNGLVRAFGREFVEEFIPMDHVCVTSVTDPEIHIADISIPDLVFRNYSSPFSLVSSNIRRIVIKSQWPSLFKGNKRGKIRVDVDGVELVVRTKGLDEFDPELCRELLLDRKRRNLEKWIKYSKLGPKSDKASKFINSLSIRVKNVKITFVDDVIYKNPIAVVIKADLVTGGGIEKNNPILNEIESKGFVKGLLSCLLFKSKGVQIEFNSYEGSGSQAPHRGNADPKDNLASSETESTVDMEDEEDDAFSTVSHFSDDLFHSENSEEEELARKELHEFLHVKRSNFCTFCSCVPNDTHVTRKKVKPSEMKYLNILNSPFKRFKLTEKEGIHVGISVKIWNFNSLFFVENIAHEPMQKIKLFLCGNDAEAATQDHYGYLFDGSVKYSQLKLNFCSEFVQTLHDFIRYVRILSNFKHGCTSHLWKTPTVRDTVRYCSMLKRSRLFNLTREDQEFFDTFERETSLGVLIRLKNFVVRRRKRRLLVHSPKSVPTAGSGKPKRRAAKRGAYKEAEKRKEEEEEQDLGIKIERLFQDEDEYEDEYPDLFVKNFENIQADGDEASLFNSAFFGTFKESSNVDDWFLGKMAFGIIAPNLRVDLIPTSPVLSSFQRASESFPAEREPKHLLDCIIAQISTFWFNIVQMSERRSSIKIFISKPVCRYAKVECGVKRRSFSCDLNLGRVFNEKIVAAPLSVMTNYYQFFQNYGAEDVSRFTLEDLEQVRKQDLIAIGIESYVNYVKKNVINMCPCFLTANSALELYQSVEEMLYQRSVNDLLSLELFLHRSFMADHNLRLHAGKMMKRYPLKERGRYGAEELLALDEFVNGLGGRLKDAITVIKDRICRKNRNLVSFTGTGMKLFLFFNDDTQKRSRMDARDMYDENEKALLGWPFQKRVNYSLGNKYQTRDPAENHTKDDVVLTILGDGEDGVKGAEEEINIWDDVDWFYNARSEPFTVKGLHLGANDCVQVTVGNMQVLVDSLMGSRRIEMGEVAMKMSNFFSSDADAPNVLASDEVNLLALNFFALHLVKTSGVNRVRLEDVEVYSNLLSFLPLSQIADGCKHSAERVAEMVYSLKDATFYPLETGYSPLEQKLSYSNADLRDPEKMEYEGIDLAKAVKDLQFERTLFNLTSCYSVPVYDPDLLNFRGNFQKKLALSLLNIKFFFLDQINLHSKVKAIKCNLLYSLVLHKLNLHFFSHGDGAEDKMKVKVVLRGANILNHRFGSGDRYDRFLSRYHESIESKDGFSGYDYEELLSGNEYEVLLGCSMEDLKANKITTKRVQHGQLLAQVIRDGSDFNVKLETRSLNMKYNQGIVDYFLEMHRRVESTLQHLRLDQSASLHEPDVNYQNEHVTHHCNRDRVSMGYWSMDSFAPQNTSDKSEVLKNVNLKIYVSSLNTLLFFGSSGVVVDLFCTLRKKNNALRAEFNRFSAGLLWSTYRRLLTLSIVDLLFNLDDYTVFDCNMGSDRLDDEKNVMTLKLSQMALWYHYDQSSGLDERAGGYRASKDDYSKYDSYKSHDTFNSYSLKQMNKFASWYSNESFRGESLREVLNGLTLLFNEYWFSHLTWCLLPTCPDEDLLLLIFSTKLSSYSRLKPIMNRQYIKQYLNHCHYALGGDEEGAILEFLNNFNITEKADAPQLAMDISLSRHASVLVTNGDVKFGEFVFNLDMSMVRESNEYLSLLKGTIEDCKNHFKLYDARLKSVSISPSTEYKNLNEPLNANSAKSTPLVLNLDLSLTGNIAYTLTDYSLHVPCSFLPEVAARYKKLRFRLLKMHTQEKIMATLNYGANLVLQWKLDENTLYSLSKLPVSTRDDSGGGLTSATLKILNEQYYTFDGTLILTLSNSNLTLDAYTNHPNDLEKKKGGHDVQREGAEEGGARRRCLTRLSSINLFDQPSNEYELVSIFNLKLCNKNLNFVKNDDRMLLKLYVDKVLFLDCFGKYVLDNVYQARCRASQFYDIAEGLLSKQRGQLILSLSRTRSGKQLNVVVENTLMELQPDFINLLATIFLDLFAKERVFSSVKTTSTYEHLNRGPSYELGNLRGEGRERLKFTLTLNMFEVWVYPSIEFYTRNRQEPPPEKADHKLKVVPKIFLTAQDHDSTSFDVMNSSSNLESRGSYYTDLFDDRMHILCLLFSGTFSNAGYYKCFIKYLAGTLGTVLLLENNFKVLVDQNDGLIISRVNDPCNRFLLEVKDFSVKFKIEGNNVLLHSELEGIKLCSSVEDLVRLHHLKDYFYPQFLTELMKSLKEEESEDAWKESCAPEDETQPEYRNLNEIFKSIGVLNVPSDDAAPSASSGNSGKRNLKGMAKTLKLLDKLYYAGSRNISLLLAVGELKLVIPTNPEPLILGLIVNSLNFEFTHTAQCSTNYSTFALAFLFEVSLLNNKFVASDTLMQNTPLRLEFMTNSAGQEGDRHSGVGEEDREDRSLFVKVELGTATVDFSNNMSRLVKYFTGVKKRLSEIETTPEHGRITLYNELEYDICIFSGNVKRELDYFMVPNNMSVKLFTRDFTLLIKNRNNVFSNCSNLLGYLDNNLLFGNTNNVKDFINLHNYSNKGSNINAGSKRMSLRNSGQGNPGSENPPEAEKHDSYLYLGRFEGSENIMKLPSLGEMILVEQIADNVLVTTNIKIENLTDISLVIRYTQKQAASARDDPKAKDKKMKQGDKVEDDEDMEEDEVHLAAEVTTDELLLDKFTSAGVPVSWYMRKRTPLITYHAKGQGGDSVQFELLKNLLNNPIFSNTNSGYNAHSTRDEYMLKFKNGLSFRTTMTSTVVNDINEVDCVKYVIRIEPIFKIFNKLPYDLVVYFSLQKNNMRVNYKNINLDMLSYDKVDSMTIIQDYGAVKELKPNQSWGIPVHNTKFYMKLLMKGMALLNSNERKEIDVDENALDESRNSGSSTGTSKSVAVPRDVDRDQGERHSLIEYLKYFNLDEIDESNLLFVSDLFEISLPSSGNLVATKCLKYKSGPIFDTTLRYFEPLLSQTNYNRNKDAFYQVVKKNFVNIRLNRNKVSVFWPYIFENSTSEFISFNGNLIPPNFKYFTTTGQANMPKLRAYVRYHNGQYVPTKEVHKIDLASTTMDRPPINLLVLSGKNRKLKEGEELARDDSFESTTTKSSQDEPVMRISKMILESKDEEYLSLGCTVRALNVSSYPTRIVVFHNYYTFVNRMPYDLIIRTSRFNKTVIGPNEQACVNTGMKQVSMLITTGAKDGTEDSMCVMLLNPSKVPQHIQIRPKLVAKSKHRKEGSLVGGVNSKGELYVLSESSETDASDSDNLDRRAEPRYGGSEKMILDVKVVEGKFECGLPCKFNGLYFIIAVATNTTYQLLNLTRFSLYVLDPNYLASGGSLSEGSSAQAKEARQSVTETVGRVRNTLKTKEDENTMLLNRLRLTPYVLVKNNDRRIGFKFNRTQEWSIYNMDTLKRINTFNCTREAENGVEVDVEVFVSCIMKRDGTRVVTFVDNYILLCKLLQRVDLLEMNRIESTWSKILVTLSTPRVTCTMSSKKKLVLAAHLNNLHFNLKLTNNFCLSNADKVGEISKNRYTITSRNDWVMDVAMNIKGCHVDHFVQGFIPVILKALNNRHSVQESFLIFKTTCTVFSKSIQTFDKIYFKLSPLSMNIEMRVMEQIVDYFETLTSDPKEGAPSVTEREAAPAEEPAGPKRMGRKTGITIVELDEEKMKRASKGRNRKFIKELVIEPITVVLAIRTSEVRLSRQSLQLLDALPLDTPSVCVHFFAERIEQQVCSFDELFNTLKNSYFKQLVRQSLPSAWLSNSLAVVYGVIKGFLYLFTQPFSCCKKFKNTAEGFLIGVNNGIKYLVLFVVGGFAQSVGHLFNIFYKIMGRGRAKPIGILDALWLGLNGLILDIFYNPWHRLLSEFEVGSGMKRFFNNAYNVLKCVLSPVSASVNLMVTIVEGLSNVLLGDFEQFTHLYETEQLSSGSALGSKADESENKRGEILRKVKTIGKIL